MAACAALSLLTAPGTSALASSPHSHPARQGNPDRVTFTMRSDFTEAASSSAPCAKPSATCQVDVSGPTEWTGGLRGHSDYVLHAYIDPADPTELKYTGPNKFLATTVIPGCGTGSFVTQDTNGNEHLAQFDPATQTIPGENDWRVVPGSGTGGLRGLSGHGVIYFNDGSLAPGSVTDPSRTYYGYAVGTLTCTPRG